MEDNNKRIINLLLNKSKEAFMMAIEIYNKPSIKYRVEGFSLFICNAWELMLKAYLIKTNGMNSIYYKDNKQRTISLENCIEKIFTNNKDPLRLNLEKIIELRNTSTHFITEEYEMVYIPLFQSCVLNFNAKMELFHNIDMTEIIPQNFLTLSVSMKELNENDIVAKYPEAIANKILNTKEIIEELTNINNEKFAISIVHNYYITKNKDDATTVVAIDKSANNSMHIVKELKDPNNTHQYRAKSCIDEIRKMLNKRNITLKYKQEKVTFNMFHFVNFCRYYDLKSNLAYSYEHKQFGNKSYTYSRQAIEFIVTEISRDPENILDNITKNKLTPGAKEF